MDERPVSRRSALETLTLGAVGLSLLRSLPASAEATSRPTILPRSSWDEGSGPVGVIEAETPLFLLVHHTADPGNDYSEADVPALLRGMYRYHTSADKGWPDIAYNFVVDRFGRIFEARSGSIAGPVAGSATGGNQGFAQLCCFLGNHAAEAPTAAAQASMVQLLAWLAVRDGIAIDGDPVTFTSRGSNRWAEGTTVTVDPIAVHRDVSQTSCPGDACVDVVRNQFPAAVTALLAPVVTTSQPPPTQPAPTEPPPAEAASVGEPDTVHSPDDDNDGFDRQDLMITGGVVAGLTAVAVTAVGRSSATGDT